MYINSYYNSNISTLFQSMYHTGNSNSSSMASLTNTVLGGSSSNSGIYSSLSDYNLIKSGSYGKLLKAYYSTEDTESSSATSTDIFEKLKSELAEAKKAESTVTETEDGNVVEKTEASDASKDTETTETTKTEDTVAKENTVKKATSVLDDLLTRNRIMYSSTASLVKQTDSLVDYAV